MKKNIALIVLVLCTMTGLVTHAQSGLRPRGDVNCDWEVNIADVNALVDSVMKGAAYHALYSYAADVNSDKEINIADINMVIDAILGKQLSPMPSFSGTLPVLYINTEGYRDIVGKEDDDYLHADWWLDAMGIDDYDSIGSPDEPMGMLIKGRGNFTWSHYEKKSFRLKLDEKQPLMGMHSNRHFCLQAHPDDYLARLKNTMGFELSRRIGLAYTPAQEPVEVVLNGQYIGLYFLTEKIRVGKYRVNIEEQNDMETDPETITGGWLLEIDNNPDEGSFIYFNERAGSTDWQDWITMSYHSPEVLSTQQKQYLQRFLTKTNAAIYNPNKLSHEWEQYIDIDTLAMFYIVGEIMDDLEYFAGSCYMYKHRGDSTKLIFGPVWDFGNAFQRWAIYGDVSFSHFIYEQPTDFANHWIEEIAKYPHFQRVVMQHWREFYRSGFNGLDIDEFINEFVESIKPAFYADVVRWPQYDIEIQKKDFKRFIHCKIDWLNQQWGLDYPSEPLEYK